MPKKVKEFITLKFRSEYLEQVMEVLIDKKYPIYFKNIIKSFEGPNKIIVMRELFDKGIKEETLVEKISEKSIYWLEVFNSFFGEDQYKFFFDKEENLELLLNFNDNDHTLLYDFLYILGKTENMEIIKEYYDICKMCIVPE